VRRTLGLLVAVPLVAAAAAVPSVATSHDGRDKDILRFDVMSGVVEPFTGAGHAIRGVPGGGLPWELRRAEGSLRADGKLKVDVKGLVLARRAPVPPAQQGTNPVPQFRGAVNCLTPDAPDTGVTVSTDPVQADARGDARIRERLQLPHPCVAPIVFVTSPTGAWFASTGR
jgi:hypothetical protein